MENLLIHFYKKSTCTKISPWYLNMYKEVKEKFNTQIYITYYDEPSVKINSEKARELKKSWLIYIPYKKIDELKEFLIKNKDNNIKIYTYYEELIPVSNEIKKILWQKVTEIDNLFISKNLQRENLLKYNKNITVNYLKYKNLENINIKEIIENFNFPFIIKPSFWISSSWVKRINNKNELINSISELKSVFKIINKNRKTKNFEVIIEEYIDWEMYTIDYYVNEKWDISKSKIIKTYTLKDEYWIDDFWVTNEITWEEVEKEIDNDKLYNFLKENIDACKIKNTFIHHEFKLTSKWKLKTIELNWRIWWYRPEFYKEAYNINLLDFMFVDNVDINFNKYYQFIWLFPRTEREKNFMWLKNIFIKKVKKLESYYNFMIKESYIWNTIWFTKNWYKYFWTIRLTNKKYNSIINDYNFIKNNLEENIIYK